MFIHKFGMLYSPDDNGNGVQKTPAEANPLQPPQANTDEPKTEDDEGLDKQPDWVKTLVKNLRKEAKDNRLKAERYEQESRSVAEARAKDEQERLAKQGEWQKLAEDRAKELEALKSVKEKAERFEAQLKATNEARVKRLPDVMRGVVPTDYTPERLAEWLDKNEQVLISGRTAPNLDAGDKGERGKKAPSPQEVLKRRSY